MSTQKPTTIDYGDGGERPLDGLAATVVLLRDGHAGPEVLLLQRPIDRGSFAGAWVFPGGVVEPADRVDDEAHDAADLRTLQRAGARETHEETGLTVSPAALVHFATWHPPQHTGRRYLTTFFAANAPNAPIVPSPEEVADHRWLRPADALALHTEDRLLLIPPTWITLHSLTVDTSVNASLERLAAATAPHFSTRATADKRTLLWQGDVAYDDQTLLHTEGPHHRLRIDERPWVYERNL